MTRSFEPNLPSVLDATDMMDLLDQAIEDFNWTSPTGERIPAPYTMDRQPCLPDLGQRLNRPGAGKATAAEFQTAAAYAYGQLDDSELTSPQTVSHAVRQRLVDGSLAENRFNYTGLDCSGFVTQALVSCLRKLDIDLYDWLKVPRDDVLTYISHKYERRDRQQYEQLYAASIYRPGLPAREYGELVSPGIDPAVVINARRLTMPQNSVPIRTSDLRPGDIAAFRQPYSHNIHLALILGSAQDRMVTMAHSGRQHHADPGGIERFALPRDDMRYQHCHPGLGFLSLHRLHALSAGPEAA